MAEVNLSSEQLDKLKAAMAKAKVTGAQPAQAPAQPAAPAPQKSSAALAAEFEAKLAAAAAGEEEPPVIETNLAEGTYLRVDDDEMAAWLYLTPPDKGQTYTKRELERYL